ncbi:hypothetical protein WISP_88593 [Willisornis vidua]|uniref:Uncharacterized protein n=1 Tax=Willisornis vidua TaxID=1566151 RepID=A0ABQ9D277_9PASS|nr:hypothetical protein WISP_88593 [Willisornis vidua]
MEVSRSTEIFLKPVEKASRPEKLDAQRLWPRGKPTVPQSPCRTCGPVEREAYARVGLLAGLLTLRRECEGPHACWWVGEEVAEAGIVKEGLYRPN